LGDVIIGLWNLVHGFIKVGLSTVSPACKNWIKWTTSLQYQARTNTISVDGEEDMDESKAAAY
jgi:hypothetical protein